MIIFRKKMRANVERKITFALLSTWRHLVLSIVFEILLYTCSTGLNPEFFWFPQIPGEDSPN